MTVRNRGAGKQKRWYYDFMIRGKRYKGAIPEARTKDEATQAENKIKKDVYDGKYGVFSGDKDFTEFTKKEYLSWSRRNSKWAQNDIPTVDMICEFFDKKTFREITPMVIKQFKEFRQDSKTKKDMDRAPATVNREMAILSKILSLAVENGIIEHNPCSGVTNLYLRLNNERIRYLTEEEEKRLMKALDENSLVKNIVITAIHTGLRRGEIFSLKWEDVDLNHKLIKALDKNGEYKYIPIGKTILALFESLPRTSEWIFPSPRTGGRLTDIKKGFRKACDDAGIKNFRFHDLRHTTATRLGEKDFGLPIIGSVLGHRDPRSTKRYTHITDRAKRRAIDSLERDAA
jgi:integrase